MFLEEAVTRPRHIEVQVLADATGEVVHLFERDCSVQRRHQKVVEIAPAPNLPDGLAPRLWADAIAFARAVGYLNAGTVEFLVDGSGRYVFIEMNPRIQVEHTVTEEVTAIDLVQAQLQIAAGATLADLGISQGGIVSPGPPCSAGSRPKTPRRASGRTRAGSRPTALPGGMASRLDGCAYLGADVSPYFDSLLVKLTCRGRTFSEAVARARRAVAEFRVRGVATNIPFLQALLAEPDFIAGNLTTAFIEERPGLLNRGSGADRGTRLLNYMADVTVNRPNGPAPAVQDPKEKLPAYVLTVTKGRGKPGAPGPVPDGSRQLLDRLGPDGFARWLRQLGAGSGHGHYAARRPPVAAGHQAADPGHAPGGAVLRPHAARPAVARGLGRRHFRRGPAVFERGPVGAAGGAARRSAQYLPADVDQGPQHRRVHALPRRGRHGLRQRGGSDRRRYIQGFRRPERCRPDAAGHPRRARDGQGGRRGASATRATSPAPSERLYTLDYYLRKAEQLVQAGVHVLCIKDMAGLLAPPPPASSSRPYGRGSTNPSTCTPTTPPGGS